MTTPTSNPNSWHSWESIAPYATPPFAAGVSIILPFYGFIAKSALQEGKVVPRMTPLAVIREGFKASPTVGTIVGTQLVAQEVAESLFKKEGEDPSFNQMLVTAAGIGAISAPALAIFNGQTLGWSPMKSLRMLSFKQAGAIVSRETSFLFALRISDPLTKITKEQFGDNKVVHYSTAFFTGMIGSVVGHPGDTMLTLWQKNLKLQSWRQLMAGGLVKGVAVGCFNVLYQGTKSLLTHKS